MEVEKSGWREVLCVPGESICFIFVWAIRLMTSCFVHSASAAAVRQARHRGGDETGVSADAVMTDSAKLAMAHEGRRLFITVVFG